MTSKNLFFKLMRENLKRRVWLIALSFVLLFFALPLTCAIRIEHSMSRLAWNTTTMEEIIRYFREILTTDGSVIVFVTCVFAAVAAIQGFSYLFSKDKTDLYHGIPTTRPQLFAPIYVNGLIVYIVPYLVCLLLAFIVGAFYGVCTPEAILGSLAFAGFHFLGYILLYSASIVAVMMTGHLAVCIMAVFVFYFYFPVLQSILQLMAQSFFRSFFSAYTDVATPLRFLSPPALYLDLFAMTRSENIPVGRMIGFIAVMVLAAAALTAAALLLYRARPSEAAGKAMAFGKTKTVIKVLLMVVIALCAGGFLQSLTTGRGDIWFLLGAVLGLLLSHCIIEIIYDFDFKSAFHHPLSLAAGAVITLAAFCVYRFDLTGFDAYTPDPEEVEHVGVASYNLDNNISYWKMNPDGSAQPSDLYEYRFANMQLSYTETIQEFVRDSMAFSEEYAAFVKKTGSGPLDREFGDFVVCYNLKNGKTKYRSYAIDMDKEADVLNEIYKDPAYKKGVFPILSLSNEQIARLRLQTYMHPENPEWLNLQEAKKNAILDSYREELLALDLPVLQKEAPVCSISLFYPESPKDDRGLTPSQRIIAGQGVRSAIAEAKSTDCLVYPSFTKTIALLEQAGYAVNADPDPAFITRISVTNPFYTEDVLDSQGRVRADEIAAELYLDEEKTAVYTDREEIGEIFAHLRPAVFWNGYPFSRSDDLTVTVTYDDKSESGSAVIPYIFADGEIPGFVEEDVCNADVPGTTD